MTATPEGKAASIKVSFKSKKTGKTSKYTFTSKVTVVGEKEEKKTLDITAFEAKTASKLVATFSESIPTSSAIKITLDGRDVSGKGSFDASSTEYTFESVSNLSKGTYTIEVKTNDVTLTKTTEVKEEYVADIKILGETALTDASVPGVSGQDKAYIYYDVLNQYGESIRNSTSLTWTVSSCDNYTVNKALGKITATKSGGFTYGTQIYVTAVHKSGKTLTQSVTVGVQQALDSVEMAGFVNKNAPSKIETSLPNDFPKNTYYLVYTVADQNGNAIDGLANNLIANSEVLFTVDKVLLINNQITDGSVGLLTIDGVTYHTAAINPGQYVDQGGEVTITAIANKTGKKTPKNFLVGQCKMLKSVTLKTPTVIVADTDQDVEIPYTAKDTEGNDVTNYETIVRSTNNLQLTASEGILKVTENNDGTAKIVWSDKTFGAGTNQYDYADQTAWDEIDRQIALTSVVVGGDSGNMMLSVEDMRRPTTVKSVNLADKDVKTLVVGASGTINIENFVFYDQYNKEMPVCDHTNSKTSMAHEFFDQANTASGFNNYHYGVKVIDKGAKVFSPAADIITKTGIVASNPDLSYNVDPSATQVETDTVEYTVVSIKTNETAANVANPTAWDAVSKTNITSYTIVPVSKLQSIALANIDKQQIASVASPYANGELAGLKTSSPANVGNFVSDIDVSQTNVGSANSGAAVVNGATVKVQGVYGADTVTIPKAYCQFVSTGAINLDASFKIVTVNSSSAMVDSSASIKWSELYNVNSAKLERKDAQRDVEINVYTTTNTATWDTTHKAATAKKTVLLSDALPYAAKIDCKDELVFNATNLVITGTAIKAGSAAKVYDQYGRDITGSVSWSFEIKDIKENTGAFAHVVNSAVVANNNTADIKLDGAELGDTFEITIYASYGGVTVSKTAKVTMGSDKEAYILSGQNNNGTADYAFRTTYLHYDR